MCSPVGTQISAGIPNITGTIITIGATLGGLIAAQTSTNWTSKFGSGTHNFQTVTFNATGCSQVYGSSDTVTPNSISTGFYIKYV